jgi:hypothetical protein
MPSTIDLKTRHEGRVSRLKRRDDPGLADRLVNMTEVAIRWRSTAPNCKKRLIDGGVPFVSFSRKSTEVWLSDLLAFEERCTSVRRKTS